MKPLHRNFSAALLSAVLGATAAAQSYPSKPVRLIVPYPPGGSTDILARLAAKELGERLKQPFVIENKAGASGAIGSLEVARATPNGYTLLMATASSHGINSSVYKNLPYDAVKDFAPVTMVASTPNIIVVNPGVSAKNLKELIALAKAEPGKLNFGSTSLGGSPHMSAELLKMMAGIDITHVPYKGAAPMLTDLIGGQIQIGFDNLPSSIHFVQAAQVRAIAVTTAQRWPGAPDIPTVAESGLPAYEVSGWFGLLAPAGTPKAVCDAIWQAMAAAVQKPEVRKQMLELGAWPVVNTPDEFAAQIRREVDKWQAVATATGVKVR